MTARTDEKRLIIRLISLVLILAVGSLCFAEILMPETGKTTKKNGKMTMDCSHMNQGYVMVKAAKSKKKIKLLVKHNKDQELNYDVNSGGNYETFPLQMGNGKYTFTMIEQISGQKYSQAGKVSITPKMADETTCFLYPNQYVSYTVKSPAVLKAVELCKDLTSPLEKAKTICRYVTDHFSYDHMKASKVKGGQVTSLLPDVDGCWASGTGVCQDLSAITCAMLRSQGVPAKLVIGFLKKRTYHAWVSIIIDGKEQRFDPTASLEGQKYSKSDYTIERFY